MTLLDPIKWTDTTGANRTTTGVDHRPGTAPGQPLVVLLHGNNGTADDMAAPAVHPGANWDFRAGYQYLTDRGWHAYPNLGVWSFELDPLKNVTSWRDTLTQRGFGTVVYSQTEQAGLLANPVRELNAVVREVIKRTGSTNIALLAHSRGGLLARRFLADNAADADLLRRITSLVTLHSPHQGSEVANVVNNVRQVIDILLQFGNPGMRPVLLWLRGQVDAPSYTQLAVGSPFLTQLAQAENGRTFVPTYTFGGTSSLFSRIRGQFFTPGSVFWQMQWKPFQVGYHWYTTADHLLSGLSDIDALLKLAPEMRYGQGDGLTADVRTRLPGSRAHRTNTLNHAEALWDPALQNQVVDILRGVRSSATERPDAGTRTPA